MTSTNSGQATAPATTTASTEVATTAVTVATTVVKGENLRNKVVQLLSQLGANQVLTIKELQDKLGVTTTDAKGKNVIQSTVSQMRQQGKLTKVPTGNRMPGYTLPVPKV